MNKRLSAACLLIAYIAILIKVMVLKDIPTINIGQLMLNFGGTNGGHPPNFIPFKTILPYLMGQNGWLIAGVNLFGNIVLLVPIGLLLPFVYQNITWRMAFFLGFLFSLVIESMQAFLNIGVFDIDDVILNTLGVMMGYWAFRIVAGWLREGKYKNIGIAGVALLCTIAGVAYAIYPHDQPLKDPSHQSGESARDVGSNRANSAGQQYRDPCNGTGGTGEIVSIGNNTITIKRNDGVLHSMMLTDRTTIKTSAGPATQSDLKIGQRVTVVVDHGEIAMAVLICGG